MESTQENNIINVNLTKDESLVLLEWLSNFNELENYPFKDESEQKILWELETVLEKQIPETFKDDYKKILSEARQRING